MKIYRYSIIAIAIILMIYNGYKTISDATTNYSNPKTYMVPIALIVVIFLSFMKLRMEKGK